MDRKIQAMVAAILIMLVLTPTKADAFVTEDLLPGEPINSPLYEKYSPDVLRIDYVGREEPDGIAEHMQERLFEFINMILNFFWWLYMIVVEMTIRLVNWAFSKETTNDLIDLLPSIVPSMEASVWAYLWKLGAAVSVLGAVILWAYGRTQKMISTMISLLLILAIAPIVFQELPTWLKEVNNVSTELSGRIMVTMVKADHSKYVSQQDEDKVLEAKAGLYDEEKSKEILEEYRSKTMVAGIQAIDDAIWKSLVYEPYLFANFIYKEVGREHIDNLILKETQEDRTAYFRKWIDDKGEVKKGKESKKFIFLTREWYVGKASVFSIVIVASFIPVFALIGFSFIVLYWTGVAIGRAIMGVIHFILALWPGYGFGEVGNWMYQTFAALIMKLFYSIVLSVFLSIWILIQPDGQHLTSLGLIGRIIVVLFLLFGFWSAVETLRKKTLNAPGLAGGSMSADTGQNEVGAFRRFMSVTNQRVAKPTGKVAGKLAWGGTKLLGKGAAKVAGKGGKALARVSLDKLKQRKQTQAIQSNLSEDARKTFQQMKRKGLDPMNKADRRRWVYNNPDQDGLVEEIAHWSEKDQADQAEVTEGGVPVPPPPRHSPEFVVWRSNPELVRNYSIYRQAKKRVHDREYNEYNERRKKYEKSIFRRLTQRRPRFVEPSQRAYFREYRRMLKELNKKDGER